MGLCVLGSPSVPLVTGHALIPWQHLVSEMCFSLLPSALGAQLSGWESLGVLGSGVSRASPQGKHESGNFPESRV